MTIFAVGDAADDGTEREDGEEGDGGEDGKEDEATAELVGDAGAVPDGPAGADFMNSQTSKPSTKTQTMIPAIRK
jgi:hypothetical protein